jgi:hypothetical protein
VALRELLASFDIGVNTSQIVNAENELNRLRGMATEARAAVGQGVKLQADGSALGGVTSAVGSLGNALLGLFAIGGVGGLVTGFKSLVEEGDKLKDTSTKLGVGAEDLQRFAYAASQYNVDASSAYAALGKLQKNLGEGLRGDAAAQEFAKLGISLKDAQGKAKPLQDVMGAVSDKVQAAGSEAEGAAILVKTFGKSGASLLPLMKQGSKAVEELGDEVDSLGGIMSKEFVDASDEAADNFLRLKVGAKGVGIQIAGALLPYARVWLETAVKLWKQTRELTANTDILHTVLAAVAVGGFGVAALKAAEFGGSLKKAFALGVQGTVVVGIVALLALLFGDLYTLVTGGDSAIGEFLDSVYGLGAGAAFAQSLRDAWADLVIALSDPALEPAMEAMRDFGKAILPAVLGYFVGIVKSISDMVNLLSSAVKAVKELAKIAETLESPGKAIAGLLSSGGNPSALFQAGRAGDRAEARGALGAAVDTATKSFGSLVRGSPVASDLAANRAKFAPEAQIATRGASSVDVAPGAVTQQVKIDIKVADQDTASGVAREVNKGLTQGPVRDGLRSALAGVF